MRCSSLLLAILATVKVNALPIPDDGTCVGSSFSPTNCDSPGAQSINVDPNVDLDPTINLKREAIPEPEPIPEPDDGTCVGSSFSPTNCDSPGAQSINVDPNVDVDPTVDTGDVASTITSTTDGVANIVTSTTNGVAGIVGSTGLKV